MDFRVLAFLEWHLNIVVIQYARFTGPTYIPRFRDLLALPRLPDFAGPMFADTQICWPYILKLR